MRKHRPKSALTGKHQSADWYPDDLVTEVTLVLPPACVQCGSPLPAVPVDPAHPDWCPSCAARAVIAPGPTSVVPPSVGGWGANVPSNLNLKPGDLQVKARPLDGVLTGIAAAAIGGAIWWGVAVATHREFVYVAILVGALAGQGVLIGTRRTGPIPAAMAFVFCSLGLLVSDYFVQRSLVVHDFPNTTIPLWQGLSVARRVVTDDLTHHWLTALFFALAALVATAGAAFPNRKPLL